MANKLSGGKRRGRVQRQSAPVKRKVNYKQLRNSFSPQIIYSDDEVVSLHNTALNVLENLGIRVMTIPIEDFFYSISLLFSSTYIFEFLERKSYNA